MVLEIRQVRDGIALDASSGFGCGPRGERSRQTMRVNGRMLIEIGERIDGGHVEPGARRRFGSRARRHADNQDPGPAHGSSFNRERASDDEMKYR